MKRFLTRSILGAALLVMAGSASAQEDGHSVTFDDFSFTYPTAVGTSVDIFQFAGDAPELEQMTGPMPPNTSFSLYTGRDGGQEYSASGVVYLWQTADFAAYPFYQTELDALTALLSEQPDLTPFTIVDFQNTGVDTLPSVPTRHAAQVLRAQPHYLETDQISGIAYITAFRQDVLPFISSEFLYTFQGLSADGTQLVSAFLHLTAAPGFPDASPSDLDYNAFAANVETYLNDSINTLSLTPPDMFTPSLDVLDAMFETFTFAPEGV